MSRTHDEIMNDLREFAKDQIKTMNEMIVSLDNVVDKPEPKRRIMDSTIFMTVGKMKYDRTGSLLRDISDMAEKEVEEMDREISNNKDG